jgi:membrane protease YdiL (CAAX protease family)
MHSMLEANGEFVPLSRHSLFVLSCLATGVFEELFFRFFVFNYLLKKLKKNLLFSILVSSALFALAHLTNLFLYSYDTYSVINQTLFAFSIGIFLQVVNIRTNSLVLVMFFHALINYWGSYRSKLVQIIPETLSEQTFNDFLTSFISIILFSLLILLPLSWVLIRNKLETKTI